MVGQVRAQKDTPPQTRTRLENRKGPRRGVDHQIARVGHRLDQGRLQLHRLAMGMTRPRHLLGDDIRDVAPTRHSDRRRVRYPIPIRPLSHVTMSTASSPAGASQGLTPWTR